jgi:lipopolysaccharide export LptBFGC system permease protein LptF
LSPVLVRYLCAVVLRWSSILLAVLIAVYLSIDVVETSSLLRVSPWTILAAAIWRLPQVVNHVLPVATTLGVLLALSTLLRQGEWKSIPAAGISPWKAVAAMQIIPALAVCVHALFIHGVTPVAMERFNAITGQHPERRAERYLSGERMVLPMEPDRVIVLTRRNGRAMFLERGQDTGTMESCWNRDRGWSRTDCPPSSAQLPPPPQIPVAAANGVVAGSLSTPALCRLIPVVARAGEDTRGLQSELIIRYLLTPSCLLLALLCVAVALRIRAESPAAMAVIGIGICAVYWVGLVTVPVMITLR